MTGCGSHIVQRTAIRNVPLTGQFCRVYTVSSFRRLGIFSTKVIYDDRATPVFAASNPGDPHAALDTHSLPDLACVKHKPVAAPMTKSLDADAESEGDSSDESDLSVVKIISDNPWAATHTSIPKQVCYAFYTHAYPFLSCLQYDSDLVMSCSQESSLEYGRSTYL